MRLTSPVTDRTPTPWHHAPRHSLTLTEAPKSTDEWFHPFGQDRATSNGLVMLGQTAQDAFGRTVCPRSDPRVDTPA